MLKEAFKNKSPLFIPFIMAGHPTFDISVQALIALAEAGADIIELGVPFSDPVADGPVNQQASDIALQQGMTLERVFSMVRLLRRQGYQTPVLLFSYLNPLLAMGHELFIKKALDAGVNGVLVVDLPPEEGHDFYALLTHAGLGIVLLASPTTDKARFSAYKSLNPSFIYYISRLAVTGMQSTLPLDLKTAVSAVREACEDINIAVGFGISTPEQATSIAQIADGVIIGSRLVSTLEHEGLEPFKALATHFREAIDG